MDIENFDVVVVGAGLSGVSAAYHLQTQCPSLSFVLLDAREEIGGTWSLFQVFRSKSILQISRHYVY
jgi:monooxygenase